MIGRNLTLTRGVRLTRKDAAPPPRSAASVNLLQPGRLLDEWHFYEL
jgi:hypothetical protein